MDNQAYVCVNVDFATCCICSYGHVYGENKAQNGREIVKTHRLVQESGSFGV